MNLRLSSFLGCLVGLLLAAPLPVPAGSREGLPRVREVRKLWERPPREYATAPLWVWNDLLSPEQIRSTLRDLAGQDVRQVFVHPRPGLMTPYLSPEWFALWDVALKEAARLDMNVWIYDENSYPSGFAGGFVPERMPEARGMGLVLGEDPGAAGAGDVVGRYRGAGESLARVDAASGMAGDLVARVVRAENSPWHAGRSYVNLLTPGVTEKFLGITLGAYDRLADEFGRRIPGVFTDEPNIRPAGGLPWCTDLPEQVRTRYAYDLLEGLPSLFRETGDWRRVRHHYYATLNQLFIERWARPYYEACEQRGLEFTGHYWDHDWPHTTGVPDNMAMAAWQHRPGVDTLMNQYAEHTHAQFGNVRYCREISSVANQLGRSRTLVELYGAGGWDLRFADMKRIADWLLVLGINTLDEHLSYVTLRGARKRDHPQSFSYHEPWWPAYHQHARSVTRLCAVLSQGRQVNHVLVLEPTTTAWMYQGHQERLKTLGDDFFALLMHLEGAQVEYDLGCEDLIARAGSVGAGPGNPGGWTASATLRVGQRSYDTVIVPPGTENLERSTWQLLKRYALAGGRILAAAPPPDRISGLARGVEQDERTWRRAWIDVAPGDLAERLRPAREQASVQVIRAAGDGGILFHHRRELEDGEVLFLVNSSATNASRGVVRSAFARVERWDSRTGATEVPVSTRLAQGRSIPFELPPMGSLLLLLGDELDDAAPQVFGAAEPQPAVGELTAERDGPNVLTLDHVDVAVGGTWRRNEYAWRANRHVWQAHGFPGNPWDNAVQFEDELIRRTFGPETGFEVVYRFTVEGAVPPDLALVVERPDLYTITCNGQPVKAPKGRVEARAPGGVTVAFDSWWLDRAFGRMPLASVARAGENEVVLRASPFTVWHEVEPAYLLGSFRLRPAAPGWVVVPDAPLSGPQAGERTGWDRQGHPFLASGVTYRQTFRVDDPRGRFVVTLPDWNGAVARVTVNGQPAGWVMAPPWECVVGKGIRRGENRVEVTVVGTLKNTLGPHHHGRARGSAWPGMFQQGPEGGLPPGEAYDTEAYGLFAPFTLARQAPVEAARR